MGLVTENYKIKSTGQFLSTAYAKLRTLAFNSDDTVTATFGIHESREKMESEGLTPCEIVTVHCGKWDRRQKHLDEFVYEKAQTEKNTYDKYDASTKTAIAITECGPLYGWRNHIIKEGE